MIPQEKSEAVARGLREAFGVSEFENISILTGGHTSSLVFRITVGGSPYVLKIILRAEDPTRHYTCMKAAAEAGLAPRVLYTSVEDKISITDFVQAQPLAAPEAHLRLPVLLRALHALPPFGRAPFNTTCTFLLNKGPMQDAFLQRTKTSGILPTGVLEDLLARHTELAAVYPFDDAEMVSSHNDLFKPDNILFDGQHLWLIDWEAAFLNDRYADLAVVANQIVTNEQEEHAFLRAYFRTEPSGYQFARFHLMQQLSHLFYALAFLSIGSQGKPVDWSGPAPEFGAFAQRMWAGEVDLADNEMKLTYGRVHWERLQQNVSQARYREALEIVSGQHSTP
ncbi:phosphotransferase [Paludibaculum fermentans]|uniref:Phosphotransferase n=1 Tax=Paludibaculum fermentans TaxID=1473598 RepID=A0A7S7NST3_PALFE|nr:phosphotransferase [Paludibaculum fermentans]QOY89178.1 phosphotransferase [Paludibaculum fermentans]